METILEVVKELGFDIKNKEIGETLSKQFEEGKSVSDFKTSINNGEKDLHIQTDCANCNSFVANANSKDEKYQIGYYETDDEVTLNYIPRYENGEHKNHAFGMWIGKESFGITAVCKDGKSYNGIIGSFNGKYAKIKTNLPYVSMYMPVDEFEKLDIKDKDDLKLQIESFLESIEPEDVKKYSTLLKPLVYKIINDPRLAFVSDTKETVHRQ